MNSIFSTMDVHESPQPSTSEAEDIVEDSEAENNAEEFSNQLPQGDTNGCSQNSNAIPSPELLPLPKPKVKRHKRPPDPSDPVGKKFCLKKISTMTAIIIVGTFFFTQIAQLCCYTVFFCHNKISRNQNGIQKSLLHTAAVKYYPNFKLS